VQKITNESVFMRVLNFVTVDGFSYEYSEQATLGGIAFRSISENYTPDTGAVVPKREPLKIFGGAVTTDHQLVAKQGDVAPRQRRAGQGPPGRAVLRQARHRRGRGGRRGQAVHGAQRPADRPPGHHGRSERGGAHARWRWWTT